MKKILTTLMIMLFALSLISFAIAEDTDGDGIDDIWEAKNFGNLSQKGTDDFDGDGRTNLDEYKKDSNPLAEDKPSFLNLALIFVLIGIAILILFAVLSKLKKKTNQ